MVSRTKKAVAAKASDTITFKKSELIKKLKYFLENENACDGDWLHKVKTQFLGQKSSDIVVTLSVPATICLNMCFDEDLPTKARKNSIAYAMRVSLILTTVTAVSTR